ncbi:hypothetical protein ACJX0J_015956 [Zea mays]
MANGLNIYHYFFFAILQNIEPYGHLRWNLIPFHFINILVIIWITSQPYLFFVACHNHGLDAASQAVTRFIYFSLKVPKTPPSNSYYRENREPNNNHYRDITQIEGLLGAWL